MNRVLFVNLLIALAPNVHFLRILHKLVAEIRVGDADQRLRTPHPNQCQDATCQTCRFPRLLSRKDQHQGWLSDNYRPRPHQNGLSDLCSLRRPQGATDLSHQQSLA